MKKNPRIRFALALIAPLAATASAGAPESYVLKQVTTSPDGKEVAQTTLVVAPGRMRMERTGTGSGSSMPPMVVVTRKDTGVAWILFPRTRRYMEMSTDDPQLGRLQQGMTENRKVESLGKESILGQDCEKKRVSNRIVVGKRTVETGNTIWECEGFEQPLKIVGNAGAVTETVELTPGPQPDALFEIPEGFQKVSNMMEGWRGRPLER